MGCGKSSGPPPEEAYKEDEIPASVGFYVSVTLYEGKDIPQSDMFSESDPYVTLELNGIMKQSTTIDNSNNPKWGGIAGESFDWHVPSKEKLGDLMISLYDKDIAGSEKLGTLQFSTAAAHFLNAQPEQTWLPVTNKADQKKGELLISVGVRSADPKNLPGGPSMEKGSTMDRAQLERARKIYHDKINQSVEEDRVKSLQRAESAAQDIQVAYRYHKKKKHKKKKKKKTHNDEDRKEEELAPVAEETEVADTAALVVVEETVSQDLPPADDAQPEA